MNGAPELVEALFFPKLARPSTRHPQRQSIFDLLPYYDCLLTMHGKDLIFLLIAALMGWVIGMCAEILVPGKAPRSFVGTTLVGVGGAILGALIGRQFGWWHRGQVPGFILSLVGAILLLMIYRFLQRRSA